MSVLRTKSLAQIVKDNHHAAAVFEKYHLDFCCRGKRTLEQACSEKQLDVEPVLADLAIIDKTAYESEPLPFEEMTLSQLADYIEQTHHDYVKKEIPLISGYLAKVFSKHGDTYPELAKIYELFAALSEEMGYHMQKEEKVLFPRIREIEKHLSEGKELVINNTYLIAPINMMESEHDHAGSLLSEIRQLTGNYTPPPEACTTFRLSYAAIKEFELDLHRHVHLENNILFPKALNMFQPAGGYSLN